MYLVIISGGGINCNETLSKTGVCGGYEAYMNNMESYDGLDFGRDYCLSGELSLHHLGKPRDDGHTRHLQEKPSKIMSDIGCVRVARRWR